MGWDYGGGRVLDVAGLVLVVLQPEAIKAFYMLESEYAIRNCAPVVLQWGNSQRTCSFEELEAFMTGRANSGNTRQG